MNKFFNNFHFTEIDFAKSPTTLVVGQNGAGKSTMLDALSFGLFGKPHRKISKTQLVNTINGKGVAEVIRWMPEAWGPALAWCDSAAAPHPTLLPSLGHPAWRERWPAGTDEPGLEELASLVSGHLARFRIALPHEANALRRGFESRLLAAFRRRPVEASAVFAWLALAALDLERLRGEIERRLAFPEARIAT